MVKYSCQLYLQVHVKNIELKPLLVRIVFREKRVEICCIGRVKHIQIESLDGHRAISRARVRRDEPKFKKLEATEDFKKLSVSNSRLLISHVKIFGT